jgi:hypothetical protein
VGSTSGLVIDTDDLRKKVRGLVHPKCKAFLALGRDNALRFQMAITYLEQRSAAPPHLIGRSVPVAIPKSLE